MFIKRGLGEIVSVIKDKKSLETIKKDVAKPVIQHIEAQIDRDLDQNQDLDPNLSKPEQISSDAPNSKDDTSRN